MIYDYDYDNDIICIYVNLKQTLAAYNISSISNNQLSFSATAGIPIVLNIQTSSAPFVGDRLQLSTNNCGSLIGSTALIYNGSNWLQDANNNNVADGPADRWMLASGVYQVCFTAVSGTASNVIVSGATITVTGGT
jgi:hypothetical protein